ncbi:helix-turn-helix domain-containing protein [Actinoallomurus sp. CA-150999]|uniref:helix-turn-helix domain-containing protein n=1 Tax=Actinoallomurus sp. CA-150999 TaxID=3239887 RepID=UPI003D94FAB9
MDIDPSASAAEQYAYRLRLYRERAELTQDDVGRECIISGKMIGHFENGRRIPTLDVSKGLDRLFNLDRYFEELHPHVVREVTLPMGFAEYIEYEQQAASLKVYEPQFVPGLLQSETYARALLSAANRGDRLERGLAVRMGRQDILQRDEPPFIVVLIKEAALREPVGGVDVMREQLAHLLEMMERPNISIQVIPAGRPVYLSSGFTLLGFVEGLGIGYADAAGGYGHLIQAPQQVHELAIRFEQIRGEALSWSESEKRIRAFLEEM